MDILKAHLEEMQFVLREELKFDDESIVSVLKMVGEELKKAKRDGFSRRSERDSEKFEDSSESLFDDEEEDEEEDERREGEGKQTLLDFASTTNKRKRRRNGE